MHPSSVDSTPQWARFDHESGVKLRLQAFVLVRNAEGRVAAVRTAQHPESWTLPGESLLLNEAPDHAARAIAANWFTPSIAKPRLVSVESYPATGTKDPLWYLIFLYEAPAPAGLEPASDMTALAFFDPGKPAGPWAMDHAEIWERLDS